MCINLCHLVRKSNWETSFREKSEVISTAEMVCCRRIVELCQHMITAGYYYHCVNNPTQTRQRRFVQTHPYNQFLLAVSCVLLFHRPSSQFPTSHFPYPTLPKSTSLPTIKKVPSATKQRSVSCTRFPPSLSATLSSSPYKTPTSLSKRQSSSKL